MTKYKVISIRQIRGNMFFSTSDSAAEDLLFSLYKSEDRVSKINRISASDLLRIKEIVVSKAYEILQITIATPAELEDAKALFIASIDRLWNFTSKVPAVNLSYQILQYHTVITHITSNQSANLRNLLEFLAQHTEEYGNWKNNPLIMEYILLRIYQDLTLFPDTPWTQDLQNKNDFILEKLNDFSENITRWKREAPDNTFVHYLDCMYSLLVAKALDFQTTKYTLPPETNCLYFVQSRSYFLTQALDALTTISSLIENATLRSMIAPCGMEFSLGRNALIRPPMQELQDTQHRM